MRSRRNKSRIQLPGISAMGLLKTLVIFLFLFGLTVYLIGMPSALSYFTHKSKSDLITFDIPEIQYNLAEENELLSGDFLEESVEEQEDVLDNPDTFDNLEKEEKEKVSDEDSKKEQQLEQEDDSEGAEEAEEESSIDESLIEEKEDVLDQEVEGQEDTLESISEDEALD